MINAIRALIVDVDGTMTDGTSYHSRNGEAFMKFSHYDGYGVHLLIESDPDIKIVFLFGNYSEIFKAKYGEKKCCRYFGNVRDKATFIQELLFYGNNVDWRNVACIGDDVNDIGMLSVAMKAGCPANSHQDVKKISGIYICENYGGDGAVREFIENVILPH